MAEDSNKRKHVRVRIPLLVQYRVSPLEEFVTDYASDVSEGGVFINTTRLPAGSTVYMQFLTRDGMHMISADARVVRTVPEAGQGVQFVKLDGEDMRVLRELIERLSQQGR